MTDSLCGHCALLRATRCPTSLRRPPAGVCLRRSRPLSHPMGDPETVVGNDSGKCVVQAGGTTGTGTTCPYRGHTGEPRPKAAGFSGGFPAPLPYPSWPAQGPAARAKTPGGTGRRAAGVEPRWHRPKPWRGQQPALTWNDDCDAASRRARRWGFYPGR
jgi:hypothetical protein